MRQLSFFPPPAPRERSRRGQRAWPAPTSGATIRLADLPPGATRAITCAGSTHNGARSYYAVYEARLTNHGCAHVEDPLIVHTSIGQAGRLRFSFVYEIRRETDDTLVASGETLHILVDAGSGQPSRVPIGFTALWNRCTDATQDDG